MNVSTRSFVHAALTTIALLALAIPAAAQVPLTWDHYKVYQVLNPQTAVVPVILSDQFVPTAVHDATVLEWFQNPVQKEVPGLPPFLITNPRLHYTWWRINPHPWQATVTALNQFGDQTLLVGPPRYLLNPAVKNETPPGPIPVANHYKCYDCQGPPVDRPVTLTDQFGIWQAQVTIPRFFCNPVRKINQLSGNTYDIVNVDQHYVVYELLPPDGRLFTGVVTDQFVQQRPLELQPGRFLAVPTHKERVTSSKSDSWGRIKTIYR
jgi:hypothetical protein